MSLAWLTNLFIKALLVSADESSLPSTDCMMSGLFVAPGTVVAAGAVVVDDSDVMCGSSGR